MRTGTLDIIGQIADLKDVDYRNTLAISVLIELLIEEGLFTRQQFAKKTQELENQSWTELLTMRRKQTK